MTSGGLNVGVSVGGVGRGQRWRGRVRDSKRFYGEGEARLQDCTSLSKLLYILLTACYNLFTFSFIHHKLYNNLLNVI